MEDRRWKMETARLPATLCHLLVFLKRNLVGALPRCEISASGGIPRVARGNQTLTGGRKATVLLIRVRTGCAAGLANLAKRLECGQLAGAFGPPTARQSGSK